LPVAVALACCVALLTGVYLAFPSQFKHQLEISVARQPQPYTQLYFGDLRALPASLTAGRTGTFTFTVVNDEGRQERYRYVVTASTGTSAAKTVAHGIVRVGFGQLSTRRVKIGPFPVGVRYLITVTLAGLGQSIHFYGVTS
jgi:hypothetical protein